MKKLNSDSQYVFSIILVEKLRFVRPNWNILFEITYESKLTQLILCKGGLASVPTHGFSLNFA